MVKCFTIISVKILLLVLNYKCPNKCIFNVYMTLVPLLVIFLNFLR